MPKQDVAVEIYYDGAWHDLVADDDVLADTPIVIRRGDGDESAAMRPSAIELRLANDDDMYRTSNPESPLYGKAGVNTPLRVSVAGVGRGQGEITSWKAGQTRDFRRTPRRGKAWVDIEANGISWRINQWSDVVQSTMIKGMLSFGDDLIGVWPLEDDSQSTILSQLVAGGAPGTFTGDVTLGDSERPGGSAQSAKLNAGGRMTGTFIASTASGWQVSFAVKLPATPGSATYEEIFTWTDSTGRRWTWEVNNTNWGWWVYAADGTVLSNLATAWTSAPPTGWCRLRMEVSISGGTVTYEPAWYAEGGTSFTSASNTFAATSTGQPRTWVAQANTYNAGAWYTGVFAIDDPSVPLFNAGVLADFNGHVGETAGDRFDRILDDLGISHAINGTNALSARMGAQPVATLAELLREIRDTDDAVLFESKAAINLVLTLRNFRYNLDPALALDVADEHGLPNLPQEVTDDLPIHNVVTASQLNGGTYTAEDSTSIMGSAPPPAGRGEYRQTVDVNVYDEAIDLPQQAWWWLHRGTVAVPRFPQITVNLAALPAWKIAEVENATIGSVITLTGLREYTIRVHVLGYTEVIGTHSRTITFTCVPDQQFDVGTYDDAARYDSASTTLKTALGPSDTAATFRTTNSGDVWDTTATPYDVVIAGQRSTVTSMGAASLVSGAYDQPATLRRGVDGIRKALAADEPIHIATPGRWAL